MCMCPWFRKQAQLLQSGKHNVQDNFMNFTPLYWGNAGSAVRCASNLGGWWGTTRWAAPGRLVKLCNTIIAHPSLISHPSSPSPPTGTYPPCNYYHSWRPKSRNQIFLPSKKTEMDKINSGRDDEGAGWVKTEMRCTSVVTVSPVMASFL